MIMASLLPQLAIRFKQIRELRQVAVSELSRLAGLTTQYLHALERAEYTPGLEALSALAQAEHVAVADFFAFPSQSKLRHRARDLILRASDAQLPELLETMQRIVGTSWEQIVLALKEEEIQTDEASSQTRPVDMLPLLPLLATRLKQIRRMRNRRMAEVAVLAGLTSQSAYAIERGAYSPRLEVLQALARVYQVDVADLFAFPTESDLRHRSRDLVVRVPNAALVELVEEMERKVGTTWAEIQRELVSAPRKLRAQSR